MNVGDLIHEYLKEGFEITFRMGGEGVVVHCRAMGSVNYGASSSGPLEEMHDILESAHDQLKHTLVKR